jgi:hypothetical protein
MNHEFNCYCIKCQREDEPQRIGKMVVAAVITVLAMALTFGQRAQAAPAKGGEVTPEQPVACFKALGDSMFGGIPVGQGITLCAGTRDAMKTVRCFAQAYALRESDGGLGLPLGQAVSLCKSSGS